MAKSGHTKLELTWIGKDDVPRPEPRILREQREKSHAAPNTGDGPTYFDNMLIHGDNLLSLKALEQRYAGLVKCVYIDPPFNTGEMFDHYDDGLEHSIWLGQMRDRLTAIHRLLAEDGTLFVHIDDNELAYLTVLLDEIFGRKNRLYIVTFKQGAATGHKSINPGCVSTTNFILMYAKSKAHWRPNRVFTGRDRDKRYGQFIENYDDDYRTWRFVPLARAFASSQGVDLSAARKLIKDEPERINEFVIENATRVVRTARPDYDAVSKEARELIDASERTPSAVLRLKRETHSDMYFKNGERILFYADKLKVVDGQYVAGEPLTTLWDDLLSNNLHKEGGVDFPKGKKPELLVKRCLDLTTAPGDLVLDSFAGSGTTAAVAHKMRRRWITIELGEHADTHCLPRLKAVVDGRDPSGATEAARWRGGGGFRYFELAPSLLEQDRWGNWVISKKYDAEMLAEAMCKHEGFTYEPSPTTWWQHGHSTERDFIYVTTQTLTTDQLRGLSAEVGDHRSLLVCCGSFKANHADLPNLTLKKIPNAVLDRCEWGRDDYSIAVAAMQAEPTPEPAFDGDAAAASAPAPRAKRKLKKVSAQALPLFEGAE